MKFGYVKFILFLFISNLLLTDSGAGVSAEKALGVWYGYFDRVGGFPYHSYRKFRSDGETIACWLDKDKKKVIARLEGWVENGKIHYHRSKFATEYYIKGDHLYAKGDGWFKYSKIFDLPELCL